MTKMTPHKSKEKKKTKKRPTKAGMCVKGTKKENKPVQTFFTLVF